MKSLILILLVFVISISNAQKKELDHSDFGIWNTIKSPVISSNGEYIMYSLERGEEDFFTYLDGKRCAGY